MKKEQNLHYIYLALDHQPFIKFIKIHQNCIAYGFGSSGKTVFYKNGINNKKVLEKCI